MGSLPSTALESRSGRPWVESLAKAFLVRGLCRGLGAGGRGGKRDSGGSKRLRAEAQGRRLCGLSMPGLALGWRRP